VTQQSGSQFDDDLTVGMEDNGSFSTESIDLFEFTGGEESPIARLKTIILSIDWEINDEILQQLDDELVDLADIWATDKIKLVYIQGLSKIGKYIYKEKASAHPNSIKLLITFYHNLEKIVLAGDTLSEKEKKELLLADVQKFDQLKTHIGQQASATPPKDPVPPVVPPNENTDIEELKTLKAQVLGIDWEINDQEIQKLSDEVTRLESVFVQSKAKLILLQGIGALSSYINKMRSKSNSKAFTLLHSFYGVLENISSNDLPVAEEKQLLLSEVDKFKAFKVEIASNKVDPEPVAAAISEPVDAPASKAPPVAEIASEKNKDVLPVDTEDESDKVATDVASRLSSVFGDGEEEVDINTEESAALEGVNVETEADDDSEEDALPFTDTGVAPALSDVESDSSFSVEKLAGDLAGSAFDAPADVESIVGDEPPQGVDVETEADDDSDEEALPFVDGEIAPALSDSADNSGFNEDSIAAEAEENDGDDLDNRLDSFFDDEVESSASEWGAEIEEEVDLLAGDDQQIAALSDVTDETREASDDEAVEEEILSGTSGLDFLDEDDAPAPALSADDDLFEEDSPPELDSPIDPEDGIEDELTHEEETESQLSFLDEDIEETGSVTSEEILEEELAVEEEVADFFDDSSPAPALSSGDEFPLEENEPESATEDPAEENLSFLDEDIPAPESTEADELLVDEVAFDEETEESNEAFFDDDAPAAALSDDTQEDDPVLFEEEVDEPVVEKIVEEETVFEETTDLEEQSSNDEDEGVEEALSFFEEEPEPAVVVEEELSVVSDDPVDESIPEDEIEFTVPGEIVATAVAASAFIEKESPDDVIDFQVPGEDDSPDATPLESAESDNDEIVFEAVDDTVEVDPLPGEEFADSTTDLEDDSFATADVAVETTPEDFRVLEQSIERLQTEATEGHLQACFAEINSLRAGSHTNTSGKIFLQLLSTVCQYVQRNSSAPDDSSLALLDTLYSGLQLSSAADVAVEKVQEHLLSCTSQVLLLQQKDIVAGVTAGNVESSLESDSSNDIPVQEAEEKSDALETTLKDEKLVSFVQEELADIRKLFLEEIKTLRKEIVDK